MWAPSGVSIWSSPTLDIQRKAIYVGTGINFTQPTTANSDAVLAFDMNSGRILWSKQFTAGDAFNFGCTNDNKANCPKEAGRDSDFGNSPILRSLGGGKRVLVLGQKSGVVHALDPDHDGKVLWETTIAEGGPQGGVLWGGASDDKGKAYFPRSDWDPGKPEAGGGLFALQLATGEKLWNTPAPKPSCLGMPGCECRPTRARDCHSRCGLFRIARWTHPRLRLGQRRHYLGFRYVSGFPCSRRSEGPRRIGEQRCADDRRGDALCQLRVRPNPVDARERSAGFFCGWEVAVTEGARIRAGGSSLRSSQSPAQACHLSCRA